MMILTCLLLGYFFGCVSPAYWVARRRGFDIRSQGTGNAGASNAAILMGWRFGVFVALTDIGKAVAAVLAAQALFPGQTGAGLLAGAACVLGHIFPFYLGFRGGKGFASYMGMILAFNWRVGLVLVVLAAVITLLSDYIVLATLTTVVVFPLYLVLTAPIRLHLAVLAAASLVIILKHLVNLRRIARGEEIGLRRVGSHPKQ